MGAILLIEEDDRNVQRLIEKLFSKGNLKAFKTYISDPGNNLEGKEERSMKVGNTSALEDAVLEFMKRGIDLRESEHIHEYIMGRVERALIGTVLEEEKGNQVRAAKRLGINRNTLRKKIKKGAILYDEKNDLPRIQLTLPFTPDHLYEKAVEHVSG